MDENLYVVTIDGKPVAVFSNADAAAKFGLQEATEDQQWQAVLLPFNPPPF